ncbi:tol-pal system protein YbgF [Rhodobacter sp. Har01]|uniref:tol-pal system protein YbgF n=1 Tax=Rhodobacter sp. Har01 TaxID=2883999 RepID=UPI001D0965BD|nr:tol-pal system protein YbgF [Rhodobacter sp. Har01]MCB6178409.1 tol-pal system protein YbgF [Rhodobacter sp. Har01]
MRLLRLALLLTAFPLAALAQDKAQTLADIRAELGQLAAEFNTLKAETLSTGATASFGGGDALQRMDAIEAELARLTSRTEQVELKLNRVVADGTNRIGDIEYRLCELTEGCDPLNLGATSVLGGDSAAAAPAEPAPTGTAAGTTGGPEMAVAEKADFDRAKEVLGQGDFRQAEQLFAAYAQSYPGGPLIPEANYLRGEALTSLGETSNAARAYLDAYSADPQSAFAPDALLKLGQALGTLGQTPEACVTLAEVSTQYPGTMAATQAPIAMQGLGCP